MPIYGGEPVQETPAVVVVRAAVQGRPRRAGSTPGRFPRSCARTGCCTKNIQTPTEAAKQQGSGKVHQAGMPLMPTTHISKATSNPIARLVVMVLAHGRQPSRIDPTGRR